ncbi:probable G-protein coupled receptor 139 [Mytilus edulis]|uniref:probable G-protein coupled receptor 139 n=1 Tax=Mytilus edulis TaxID=6550 RepID=UPI0039EE4CB8
MDDYFISALRDIIDETKGNLTTIPACNLNGSDYNLPNCSDSSFNFTFKGATVIRTTGLTFFTYITPIIFIIGVVGNTLSLLVFLTRNMRRLPASLYLAAISCADLMALLSYVLIEWLRRGLPTAFGSSAPLFLERDGTCHVILFLIYNFRFLSSWLVVCFTVERYIGVCHPLKRRRNISDTSSSRRVIAVVIVISVCVALFRPWLNKEINIGPNKVPWCVRRNEYRLVSFVYDCIFCVSITFIPFFIITCLNALIIRKLIRRNKHHRRNRIISEESIIRLEFTLILIAVSVCFVVFNTPYAVLWLTHFINSGARHMDIGAVLSKSQNILYFTKTVYFMNYSVHFFLYSITGAYFRKELLMLFKCKSKNSKSYYRCSVRTTSSIISKSGE